MMARLLPGAPYIVWAAIIAALATYLNLRGIRSTDYLSADGSNNVAVSVDVHDLAGMQKAIASPEMEAAKRAHGVIEPVAAYIQNT